MKDGQEHLSLRSEDPTVLLGDEMIGLVLWGEALGHMALMIFVGLINEILLAISTALAWVTSEEDAQFLVSGM